MQQQSVAKGVLSNKVYSMSKAVTYFTNHSAKTDYAASWARHLLIGSGAVEAAYKMQGAGQTAVARVGVSVGV